MTRFAAQRRVFYVEEPVWTDSSEWIEHTVRDGGVNVVVLHLQASERADTMSAHLSRLLLEFFRKQKIVSYCLWYYTPMAVTWTYYLKPLAVVYDCMDELSAFKDAPVDIKRRELELFSRADLVFTGGPTLFEVKSSQHPSVYAFPSSIDVPHFAQARSKCAEPEDQAGLPRPRLGFSGVIDERMDLELLAAVASARPDWQIIMLGPVVKIEQSSLPENENIHYLGMKQYEELPRYMSAWNAAILPFARNESTRFISPTKTPEYLAAGQPVVSTSVPDVVGLYGTSGIVRIADRPGDFITAVEQAMTEDREYRLRRVDRLLSRTSWSQTWGRMAELLDDAIQKNKHHATLAYSATANGIV